MKLPRTTLVFPCIAAITLAAAQPCLSAADTYRWGAKFVSFDEAAHTVTVKAGITGLQPILELPKLKPGERILFTWAVQAALNGPDRYGDSISDARRYDGRQKLEAFMFVAEFVSFDAADQSVTFRIAVAPQLVQRTRYLKPGDPLIATSPLVQPASNATMSIQELNSLSSSF